MFNSGLPWLCLKNYNVFVCSGFGLCWWEMHVVQCSMLESQVETCKDYWMNKYVVHSESTVQSSMHPIVTEGCGTSLCRWVLAEGYTRPYNGFRIHWNGVSFCHNWIRCFDIECMSNLTYLMQLLPTFVCPYVDESGAWPWPCWHKGSGTGSNLCVVRMTEGTFW